MTCLPIAIGVSGCNASAAQVTLSFGNPHVMPTVLMHTLTSSIATSQPRAARCSRNVGPRRKGAMPAAVLFSLLNASLRPMKVIAPRCIDRPALHVARNRHAEVAQDGRRDIHDLQPVETPPAVIAPAVTHDANSIPVVVGTIRPDIVVEGIHTVEADAADRSPAQVAEVHDEGGGDAGGLVVHSLGPIRPRAKVTAGGICNSRDAGDQFVAEAFVCGGLDDPLRLTPLYVHK